MVALEEIWAHAAQRSNADSLPPAAASAKSMGEKKRKRPACSKAPMYEDPLAQVKAPGKTVPR